LSHLLLLGNDLSLFLDPGARFGSQLATAPLSAVLDIVVVTLTSNGNNVGQLGLVLLAGLGQSNDRGNLLANELSQPGSSLNNNIGNILLAAKGGEPQDELDGVNIVGNDNQLGTVGLNERSDVVDSRDDGKGALDSVQRLSLGLGVSELGKALFLLELGLGAVLVEQAEQLKGLVLGQHSAELSKCGGHLKTLLKDSLLSLDPYALGPLNEAGEVTLGEDVIANGVVSLLLSIQGEGKSP